MSLFGSAAVVHTTLFSFCSTSRLDMLILKLQLHQQEDVCVEKFDRGGRGVRKAFGSVSPSRRHLPPHHPGQRSGMKHTPWQQSGTHIRKHTDRHKHTHTHRKTCVLTELDYILIMHGYTDTHWTPAGTYELPSSGCRCQTETLQTTEYLIDNCTER